MAKRKRKKDERQHRHRTAEEILIEQKAKSFLAAERSYWEQRSKLTQQWGRLEELGLGGTSPAELSSTVFGLKDGVAFVRHTPVKEKPEISFRIFPQTLDDWAKYGLIVPLKDGDLALAGSGFIGGLGHFVILNCSFNNRFVPYAEFSHLRYSEKEHLPSVQRAVLDFQLMLMGIQARQTFELKEQKQTAEPFLKLAEIADDFERLLNDAQLEEELQKYLRDHPVLLLPSGKIIPKQKLGEDFVTDFVLVSVSISGPIYTLVEIEKASYPVLTKDLSLSSAVTHALQQISAWDTWLESNKSDLAGKLPGFETPNYKIIIGRGVTFDDREKKCLRAYNRRLADTELLTYDDILVSFRATIAGLERAYKSEACESNKSVQPTASAAPSTERHGP